MNPRHRGSPEWHCRLLARRIKFLRQKLETRLDPTASIAMNDELAAQLWAYDIVMNHLRGSCPSRVPSAPSLVSTAPAPDMSAGR